MKRRAAGEELRSAVVGGSGPQQQLAALDFKGLISKALCSQWGCVSGFD